MRKDIYDACQGAVGHHKTTRPPALELMGEQAESIGVALKMSDVVPEGRTDLLFQETARSFCEESLYGFLTTVSERRIP